MVLSLMVYEELSRFRGNHLDVLWITRPAASFSRQLHVWPLTRFVQALVLENPLDRKHDLRSSFLSADSPVRSRCSTHSPRTLGRLARFLRLIRIVFFFWRGLDQLQRVLDVRLMKRSLILCLVVVLLGAFAIHQLEGNADPWGRVGKYLVELYHDGNWQVR